MTLPNATETTGATTAELDPLHQADDVRHAVADSVPLSLQLLKENELPQADDSFLAVERSLRQDRYTVLVCGEAKRGKSTFINALIGKSVLPTDVDIATSQVFQIRAGEEESYAVRYEDESAVYIDPEDLAHHGSQVVQDAMDKDGFAAPSITVRQIEISLPAKFLPSNITLLDTPGLGSLYVGHAKITYRFVPQADAVLFVLDSNAPITKPELTFLGEILDVTPHVFFLQTRIDQVRQADWEKVLARNTAIIRERFALVLGDNVSIWPVSSQMLLKAGQNGNRSLIEFSRFEPMLAALRRFLFQATGIYRTRRAVEQLTGLYSETRPILAERVDVLMQGPKGEREKVYTAQKERASKFNEEWGPTSRGRREVEDRLRDLLDGHRSYFINAIQPHGSVEAELQTRVDRLADTNEAEPLAHALASQATERVNMRWRQVSRQSVQETAALLAPICGWVQCDTVLLQNLLTSEFFMNPSNEEIVTVRDNVVTRLQATWKESGILMGAGAAVAAFMPVVGLPVAAVAAGFGYFTSGEKLAEQAKKELNQFLQKVLSDIRAYYMEADTTSGRTNRSQLFFRELERACRSAMEDEYERRVNEQKREVERLQEMASAGSDEAAIKLTEAREALRKWDNWGTQLKEVLVSLDQLAKMPLPSPAISIPVPVSDPLAQRSPALAPGFTDTNGVLDQFQRTVATTLVNGFLNPQEQLFLRREAIRFEIPTLTAETIVREEINKRQQARRSAGGQSGMLPEAILPAETISTPEGIDTPLPGIPIGMEAEEELLPLPKPLPVANPEAERALRRALVAAVREAGPNATLSDESRSSLESLVAEAALSEEQVAHMEQEIREELVAAVPIVSPREQYSIRFTTALTAGNGTVSDDDQDELDALADTLHLSRADTRAIEKDVRAKA